MILKDKIKDDSSFAYVVDSLETFSSAGRQRLLEQPWLREPAALQQEWDNLETVVLAFQCPDHAKQVTELRHQLMELQNLQGTLQHLRSHTVVDEIELFLIKKFAFHALRARQATLAMRLDAVCSIPDLSPIFRLLDPDSTGVPTFYIYDSYHSALAPLRKELRSAQARLASLEAKAENALTEEQQTTLVALREEVSTLLQQQDQLQEEVLRTLADRLAEQAELLADGMERMAYTDLLQAKATQAIAWQLAKPTLSAEQLQYNEIANLRLQHRNQEQHLRYQPIDIALKQGVCLITGANMAGKTMVLKTIGCAQLMAQFGMFVPATTAAIVPLDDVLFCIGDEMNEMNGLSSFAGEIIKISNTVQRAVDERLLILIDEPARTTNPVEGKAIVQAIATLLDRSRSFSLITTHYSRLGLSCRRLRVRGFVEEMIDQPLTPATINQYMDYSLLPDTGDEVPQEALRIATILGCDKTLISLAQEKLTAEQG